MNIPTSKKELLAALTKGTAKLLREMVELLSSNSKNQTENVDSSKNTDDSIIDVTNEFYTIPQPLKNQNIQSFYQVETKVNVPYWENKYIYSFSEIDYAIKKQKEFYTYFKNLFLQNDFVDLENNNNYAFILLFDLLREFKKHKNIDTLETHLVRLGHFYPKTKSYEISFLIEKMKAIGDSNGV